MERENRVFGNNLRFYAQKKGIKLKWLADQLECSEYEVQKMMDARLFLDRCEQEHVAEILGVTVDMLYQPLEDKDYESAGCIEYRGEFSAPEHKKQILDLFDVYCDVQEILAEEGLKPSISR